LEARAGVGRVLPVHGSFATATCARCGVAPPVRRGAGRPRQDCWGGRGERIGSWLAGRKAASCVAGGLGGRVASARTCVRVIMLQAKADLLGLAGCVGGGTKRFHRGTPRQAHRRFRVRCRPTAAFLCRPVGWSWLSPDILFGSLEQEGLEREHFLLSCGRCPRHMCADNRKVEVKDIYASTRRAKRQRSRAPTHPPPAHPPALKTRRPCKTPPPPPRPCHSPTTWPPAPRPARKCCSATAACPGRPSSTRPQRSTAQG